MFFQRATVIMALALGHSVVAFITTPAVFAPHSNSNNRGTSMSAGAGFLYYCSRSGKSSSSGGGKAFGPSSFCPRKAPPALVPISTGAACSSSSSHPPRTGVGRRALSAARRRRTGWAARGSCAISMKASGGGGKGESLRNRVIGTVVYLLPLLDGLEFGRDVFHALPPLGYAVHAVLAPALAVWDHVPFLPLVMFIILQVSVRNQDTSRFVRFNVQQAILVDILTVVLGLLGTAADYVAPGGQQFVINFAFYCLVGAVAYAVAETARGKMANQIPLISAAAEIQLGPS